MSKTFQELLAALPTNADGPDITNADLTELYQVANKDERSQLNMLLLTWRPDISTMGEEYNGPFAILPSGEKYIDPDCLQCWKTVRRDLTVSEHLLTREEEIKVVYDALLGQLESAGLSFDDLVAYSKLNSGHSVFGRLHAKAVPPGFDEFGYRIKPAK